MFRSLQSDIFLLCKDPFSKPSPDKNGQPTSINMHLTFGQYRFSRLLNPDWSIQI